MDGDRHGSEETHDVDLGHSGRDIAKKREESKGAAREPSLLPSLNPGHPRRVEWRNYFGATRQITSTVRKTALLGRMRKRRTRELTNLGVMLIKSGLKPVSGGLFGRKYPATASARVGAIRQSLTSRRAAAWFMK